MRFKLQNIALGFFIKSKKENPSLITEKGFFDIDGKAISYSPNDTIVSGLRELVYPFIKALNFDSTSGTFNNNQISLENLNKIKVLNKILFKTLERLAFKENNGKIEITKINIANRILTIMNDSTFLLEINQDMIDNVISWLHTLGKNNPGLLTKQELNELEKFYNGEKLESIEFGIVDELYMKNRLNLAKKENNITLHEGRNGLGLLKRGFGVRNFKAEVGNILLNTDLTGEIEITEKHPSFFVSTSPRLTEEAVDIILN
ncbi:hypothetical protein M0P65_03870 [Candidatus Gracilibacteria bacterium]|nr:hypothetical protein [Candidatus Gracilibacteria bacterium]